MQRMLQRLPERRITIDEILRHPFLRPASEAPAATPVLAPGTAGGALLTREQLAALLQQVAKHAQRGSIGDVGALSQAGRPAAPPGCPHAGTKAAQ